MDYPGHDMHSGHDMGSMSAMDDSYGVNGNAYPPISDEVVAAASTTFAAPPFCTGSTAMYMSGFRFVLASGDGSMPCLNLFFETWTLDSPAKFVFGALFVFILAAMNEGLSALRRGVRRWMGPGKRRKALSVVTHAIQATMGYVLMLAAMTYAAEMLLAVICGMATGYALFFDDAGRVKGMAMGGDSGGMGKMTADHCLVDDVADEDFRAGGGRGENEEFDNMQTIDEQQAQGGFIEDLSSGIGSGRTYRTSNKKGT